MSAPTTELEPTAPLKRRRGRLATSAWLLVLVLTVVTFGFLASRSEAPPEQGPPRGDVAAAQRAVQALLDPERAGSAVELLPADFTAVTEAEAGTERAPDGTVRSVHLGGGCSTPWGDDATRWDYSTACRAHDLGYDLLRYAEEKGHPLQPVLREGLDDRLSADMRAMCGVNPQGSPRLCESVASVYSAGLVLNSWHQRWGPPVGEPLAPMLAGVLAIGLLLTFRMRGWHAARRGRAREEKLPRPERARRGRWAVLGAGSIVLLVLGDAGVSLARWAGAGESWLWPVTWLAQLAFVLFFAGGHANAAGWLAVGRAGGGYREYLAHRAGWLLRLALVFAVVAFAVPLALELLGIPGNTVSEVVRIALHPLWLLGLYVLTVAATPVMRALHRRAPVVGVLAPAAPVPLAGPLAEALGSPLPHYVAALAVALLAQQLAFAHAAGVRPPAWALALAGAAALSALVVVVTTGHAPPTLLGTPGATQALAGPVLPAVLLGITHLSLLGLLKGPLVRLAGQPLARRAAGLATRAPMSLYLGFLAAMCLLVALVYLPSRLGSGAAWLLAPALLAGPAAVVFWWFERHLGYRPHPATEVPAPPGAPGRAGHKLAHAATAIGLTYAAVGVFGFALTSFGGTDDVRLMGLALDPIQSLVHLLLGMTLLHTVRTGASASPGPWLLAAVASVPPLLSAVTSSAVDLLGLVAYGLTGLFAVTATVVTMTLRDSGAHRRVA